MNNSEKSYNLEQRTIEFGRNVIQFCKIVRENTISRPMINQLIRSGTSIGANYMEANGASSKKDFINKIYICKKESQETKYWLIMLKECEPDLENKIQTLWQEAHELNLIFQKIAITSRQNN